MRTLATQLTSSDCSKHDWGLGSEGGMEDSAETGGGGDGRGQYGGLACSGEFVGPRGGSGGYSIGGGRGGNAGLGGRLGGMCSSETHMQ